MESRLTFNQLICEFESRRPRQEPLKIVDFRLQIVFVKTSSTAHQTKLKAQSTKRQSSIFNSSVGRSLTAERRAVTA